MRKGQETTQQVLERRYVSRMLSAQDARKLFSKASQSQDPDEAATAKEAALQRARNISACAEISKIARDLGIELDTYELTQRANDLQREIEETIAVMEAARRNGG